MTAGTRNEGPGEHDLKTLAPDSDLTGQAPDALSTCWALERDGDSGLLLFRGVDPAASTERVSSQPQFTKPPKAGALSAALPPSSLVPLKAKSSLGVSGLFGFFVFYQPPFCPSAADFTVEQLFTSFSVLFLCFRQ